MTDHDRFEARLEARLLARAAQGDRPFDQAVIAHAAVARARSTGVPGKLRLVGAGGVGRWPGSRMAFVAILLLLALAGLALVAGSGLLRPSPIPAERGVFTPTGSPMAQRGTATRLPDGRVLVLGYAGAETWDPATGTFSPAGEVTQGQGCAAAALLGDGHVLVVCGRSAELWDPRTSSFTPSGSLKSDRVSPIAITLPDGRVLVMGGYRRGGPNVERPEMWDPKTGAFADVTWPDSPLAKAAVLLRDGRVLVFAFPASGTETWDASIWDPSTQASAPTGAPIPGHVPHGATLMPDGRVAVTSGCDNAVCIDCDTICVDVWDPVSGTFSAAGQSVEAHRGWGGSNGASTSALGGPTVTLLRDGRVLVAGGLGNGREGCATDDISCSAPTLAAELWDPVTRSFSPTGSMNEARSAATATLLLDGRVLIVGAMDSDNTTSAELFTLR